MESLIVILVCLIFICIIKYLFGIKKDDVKKIKELGYNKELTKITDKLPDNKIICEEILKKLDNEKVKIKETESKTSSLYIVATNTILISDIKDTFTRVQTIAHECLHSIQNKRMVMFNYIYSNIYIIYFVMLSILALLGKVKNMLFHVGILAILGFIYYIIRSYLETDAMIKAEYLAKSYMEDKSEMTKEEIEQIVDNYKKINNKGIAIVNFSLLMSIIIKIVIFEILLEIGYLIG